MSQYNEASMRIRRWLTDEQRDRMLGLSFGQSYADLMSVSGRMLTTAAVKFNRNLLVTDVFDYPNDGMGEVFVKAAGDIGFKVLTVPAKTINRLRACLRETGVPAVREAKSFRRWLPPLPADMKPFPRLDHRLEAINDLRIQNAFTNNGDLTHAIVYRWKNQKDKVQHSIKQAFKSEDEAMLHFMKLPKTENYSIMEIGGC